MAFLGQVFNAADVQPSQPRGPIPAGTYIAQIVQSEMRDTRTGGQYLSLELDIIDGEFRGRKLWDNLNLVNSNAQAAEIAQRTLSAICHAIGQMTVQDSEQLHFKPMRVTVKVQPAGPDKSGVHREAQNRISGYAACTNRGSVVAARDADASAAADTRAAQQPAGGFNAPWKKAV